MHTHKQTYLYSCIAYVNLVYIRMRFVIKNIYTWKRFACVGCKHNSVRQKICVETVKMDKHRQSANVGNQKHNSQLHISDSFNIGIFIENVHHLGYLSLGFRGPDPFSAVGPQTFLRVPDTNPRKNCQPPSRLQALFKTVVTSGSVATWVSVNFGVYRTIGLPIDNGQSFSWFGTHWFFGHHHIGSGCPSTNCGTETIKSATGCWMTIQPLCKHLGAWHVNWRFYFGKIAGIPYTAKHEFELRGITQWSNFCWLFLVVNHMSNPIFFLCGI